MNERIKELAIEAGIISAEYNGFDSTGLTKAQRKFAELIVRECLNQVREQYVPVLENEDMMKDTHWDGYVQCGVDCHVAIREHFGIEQ